MADSNQSRRADYSDFSETDPFAELARIMGHDPRSDRAAPEAPAAAAGEDDFGIDLEKELMGDLDFSEFDEPRAEEVGPISDETSAQAHDWRQDLQAAPVEDGVAHQPAFEVDHSVEDLAASIMDSYEAEEAELHPAEPAAVVEHAPVADMTPATMRPVEVEEAPVDEMLERELTGWDAPEGAPAAFDPVAADSVQEDTFVEPAADALAVVEPEVAYVEQPEAGEPLFEQAAEAEAFAESNASDPYDQPQASFEAEFVEEIGAADFADSADDVVAALEADEVHAPDRDQHDEPHRGLIDTAPEPSLEDELNALLSAGDDADESRHVEHAALQDDDGYPAPQDGGYPAPQDEAAALELPQVEASQSETQAVQPQEEWRPSVHTFGRTNFVAPKPVQPAWQPSPAEASPSALEAELDPVDLAEMPEWDEPEPSSALDDQPLHVRQQGHEPVADAWASEAAQPQQSPVAQDDVFTSIFAQALAEDTDRSSGSTAAELDEVLSHFSVTVPRDEPAPVRHASARETAPAIETVDVTEAAYAVSDDLDLPEIDYGTPAAQPAPFDDFGSDFAHAFEATADVGADQAPQPAAGPSTWSHAAPYAQQAAQQPASPAAVETTDPYALGEGEWQAEDLGLGDDFSFDDEFEQALASSAVADEGAQGPSRGRRGLIVAAAVAGVAVFGGLGVLGMSMFGSGSDSPAVVRADSDPMKIRPENPGGTVVPNQDSQAYNRVASGPDATAPVQEELLTTAEEPVDIAAETAPAPALPTGMAEGEEVAALSEPDATDAAAVPADPAQTDAAATSAAPAQPKSEERIEPVAQEPEGVGATGDLLAVAPRKVRTMIVRPDGTMVPREVPEPQEETVVAAAPLAAPALAPAAAPTTDQAAAPLASQEDAGPSVETPATVGVVPSQRAEPQAAPVAAAQPAPQAVTQTPPATPVAAPAAAAPVAAATGEWSMQIASQPTAESAQATYQDLARRYGSVLEGRGVNIVKADIAGKGTYYRVRIPSASRDEAIDLCTKYKSAGGSCFVSR